MGAEVTTIIVAVITAIIGPVVVYYFTYRRFEREFERQREINELLQLQKKPKEESLATGIKITSIRDDAKVDRFFTVSGTYKNTPSNKRLQLFVIAPKGESGYWPQGVATFDNGDKTWRAEVHVGGNSGDTATIIAAVVGPEGQALCNYYKKVGDKTQQWPSIDVLTSDISEVDRVKVVRK